MRALILKYPLTTVLGFVCALLLAILVSELLFPPSPSVITPEASQTPQSPLPVKKDDFSLPPLSQFQAIVERPLFLQSRRPIPGATTETSPAASKETRLNQYSLTAVVIVPDKRLALLRSTTDKKIHKIEEGQDLQGWKLKEIKDESALLQQVNESQELRLQRKTPPQFAFNKQRSIATPPPATPDSTKKDQRKPRSAQESEEKPPSQPPQPAR
ncbi:MAG TPA: hypothetical protein VHH94_06075 [Gammaproteobacteria bacterium]|nr:hypothetical protein [Gammaproteobacteria bacterium]